MVEEEELEEEIEEEDWSTLRQSTKYLGLTKSLPGV